MKRIGIIRGGNWSNYERSLKEGAEVSAFIKEHLGENWFPLDIFVDKDGAWHINGLPVLPSEVGTRAEIFWNASSPEVTSILENFGLRHVSVPSFPQALRESREMLRTHMMQTAGINMPRHILLPGYQKDFDGRIELYAAKKAMTVFEKFSGPWMVRSPSVQNAMGVHVAKTYPELVNAIIDAAEHGASVIVEELIPGREVSMHSLKNFRGEDLYVFPARLSREEKDTLYKKIREIHDHTGSDYLMARFILHPKNRIYLKHLEFTPSFGKDSDLHQVAESIGAKASHILESILENKIQ
jgi:hypothetical protein